MPPGIERTRLPLSGKTGDGLVEGLHVHRSGDGAPLVVFEAGLAATSLNWRAVQQQLHPHLASVSYDRPGIGSSPPSAGDRSLRRHTDHLHRLLHSTGLATPVVLTAHSFGACIARVYAHRFPEDVAALVLVDPMVPEEFSPLTTRTRLRLWRAAFFADVTALAAGVGLVRLGLWGLLRRGPARPGPLLGLSPTLRRVAGELGKLPPDVVAALRRQWSRPRFFRELAASIRALPACASEALRHPVGRSLPIVVLSGAHQTPAVLEWHRAIATDHQLVEGSAHWIHLDRPRLVADVILRAAGRSTAPRRASRTE